MSSKDLVYLIDLCIKIDEHRVLRSRTIFENSARVGTTSRAAFFFPWRERSMKFAEDFRRCRSKTSRTRSTEGNSERRKKRTRETVSAGGKVTRRPSRSFGLPSARQDIWNVNLSQCLRVGANSATLPHIYVQVYEWKRIRLSFRLTESYIS